MHAVLTGYEERGNGFVPKFDVFIDDHKTGELAGGFPYATTDAAIEAGGRVVEYLKTNGKFPNLCAHF